MIHPNMCTLLAYLTTDIAISKGAFGESIEEDVQDTFNMISIDGDTSTNDTLLILANGMARAILKSIWRTRIMQFLRGTSLY